MLRHGDQRRAHGPKATTDLPAAHAPLRGRRRDVIEPWRAKAFPVLRDLVVDRSAFDRIIQAGGYVSVRTGSAPDANACRPQGGRRPGDGRRPVHRLRRLRGGLQERVGDAVRRSGEGLRTSALRNSPQGSPSVQADQREFIARMNRDGRAQMD
jgi:hypothetical protein